MAATLDLLLSILPFEKECFTTTSLPVQYVGHPLIQRLREHNYQKLLLPEGKRLVALFPGSRTKEIVRNFSLQLKVARRLRADHPDLIFGISTAHPRFEPLLRKILATENFHDALLVPHEQTYDLMQAASAAIAKSGTVTLELALHNVPTVVIYAVSRLDQFIAQQLFHIDLPFYCLVNIIGNTEIFPELIGPHLTEERLYAACAQFLADPQAASLCRSQCHKLRQNLQEDKHASAEAAGAILELLTTK